MASPSTKDIVDEFTRKVTAQLDESKLDGPVRMDNTHTVIIIPLKGKGPVHLQARRGVGDEGVDDVVAQLKLVPSLQSLVKTS